MTPAADERRSLALTNFQIEVAQLFFSLPAAEGFLLAGGAALVAQHLTTRPNQDLDFFTRVGATSVPDARDALELAAHTQGWSIERVRDEATFCRLIVHGNDDLLVDLALDSPPEHPATASLIGPTFAPQELAGRKIVALSTGPKLAISPMSSNSLNTFPKMTSSNRPPRSIGVSTLTSSRRCSAAWPASTTRICLLPRHWSQQ